MIDRPLCECHGEPMHRNGHNRWRCSEKNSERFWRRYGSDPVYRITRDLARRGLHGQRKIERMKEAI